MVTKRVILQFLVLAVASVFVFSFASPASAEVFTVTGKVASIDKDAGTLTIDPMIYGNMASPENYPEGYTAGTYPAYGKTYAGPTGIRSFALLRDSRLYGPDNRKISFDDLHVGDLVTVSFHQEAGGRTIADGIALAAPGVLPERATGTVLPSGSQFSLSGRVASINMNSISIDPSYGPNYAGPKGERFFTLKRDSMVMVNNQPRSWRDIKVGDLVTVTYHQESNGIIVADDITSPAISGTGVMPRASASEFSLTGKVVALDTNSISIDSSYAYGPNYSGPKERTFTLNKSELMRGGQLTSLNNVKVGDWVTVNYHQESNGLIVADGVAITNPPAGVYPEERG